MNTFDKTLIRFLIVSLCYLELPIMDLLGFTKANRFTRFARR